MRKFPRTDDTSPLGLELLLNARAAASGRRLPHIGAVVTNNQDDSQDERRLVAPTEEITTEGRHLAVSLGTVAQDSSRQE
mmetsp:Transcript_2458/g.4424  ORF Transcript_2458/g.4424 Transcript_2458/m.4424 type:complete len:80 (-) Transcript_2458:122-361(-)